MSKRNCDRRRSRRPKDGAELVSAGCPHQAGERGPGTWDVAYPSGGPEGTAVDCQALPPGEGTR